MGIRMKTVLAGIGNGVRNVGRGLKSFTMNFSGQAASWAGGWLPRSNFNYAQAIGDGSRSNIVQAVVNWIARTFPEAPVMVVEELAAGSKQRIIGHPLPKLLERPNPFYSGVLLWMATLADWSLGGDAYWIKARAQGGRVVELWWAPAWTMEPRWAADGSDYISHYDYAPNSQFAPQRIAVEDVVHFRYGIDTQNTRKGCSPLRSLMREIFTDEEAANMTASLMKNLGVPGIIVSPDPAAGSITVEQAEQTKAVLDSRFTGDHRGTSMVQTAATKVEILSFSPDQMNLRDLRRVPEERVTAIYGVAAVVVGLGAGLDRATFSNFAEAREAAYEGNIIPTQRLMAADITLQLLPDFSGDNPALSAQFDLTNVRVLQPDMDKLALRMATLYRDGVAMRAEAKLAMALPVSDDDFVYSVSKNLDLLRPDNTTLHSATQPVPAVTEPGNPLMNDPLVPAGTPGTSGKQVVV